MALQWKTVFGKSSVAFGITLAAMAGTMVFASSASAHGYIESPTSRALLCKQGQNVGCGQVQYEPQSVEGKGNFPQSGPKDGEITGAGKYTELFAQTDSRWKKVDMQGGKNTFTWYLTAPHSTGDWKYYITKKDWNPNKPLGRDDLELIAKFNDGGKVPPKSVSHNVNVPTDRSGYHIILGVWEIADTGNAFYQAIDVNLKNDGNPTEPEVQLPTIPSNLTSPGQTTTSIELRWSASTASEGIKEYEVYRNGRLVGTTSQAYFEDKELTLDTAYTYTVRSVDFAGNKSELSKPFTVKTSKEDEQVELPTAPGNLVSPAKTKSTIDLSWTASTAPHGIHAYEVYRDGRLVGTTRETTFTDKDLKADTTYSYMVVAVDHAGNKSAFSQKVTVRTEKEQDGNTGDTWNKDNVYNNGDRVIYEGVEYEAQWWTSGDRPDNSDVWKQVGDVVQKWNSEKAYQGGAKVSYEGKTYQAKWWTKGEEPSTSSVWTLVQ
ncbi:lytic polysaccharide monooxygenase [Brevibacillus laterosporus]|uniref:lytic polysaccharide monooxygenase n=1 Tax=Brevibacillus laterosporus TaxID=1465 RepID=UPI0018CEC379|nr:lytic polysaccharide monooxygenase [Brevibacillus laterosporus]MBG9786533.1 chitin-binding protein [Brevibacillus laterosporus]